MYAIHLVRPLVFCFKKWLSVYDLYFKWHLVCKFCTCSAVWPVNVHLNSHWFTCDSETNFCWTLYNDYFLSNFMAHSAVWGHFPIQRQNTNAKSWRLKSCLRAVSEGLQSLVKLIQMMNQKLHFRWFYILYGISGFNMGDVISWKYWSGQKKKTRT